MPKTPKRDAVTVGSRVRLPDVAGLHPSLRGQIGRVTARRGRRGTIELEADPVGIAARTFDLGPDGIAELYELALVPEGE